MRYISKIQQRFSDFDKLGHVNNAHYLTYYERARIDFFEHLLKGKINWEKEGLILARAELDYIRPLDIGIDFQIETYISKIGTKSFVMTHEITSSDNTLMAKGNITMVAFSYEKQQSMIIPEIWKDSFSDYLESN